MRRSVLLLIAGLVLAADAWPAGAASTSDTSMIARVASPNGDVNVAIALDAQGRPSYTVRLNGAPLLQPSPLGLATTVGQWTRRLEVQSVGRVKSVTEHYRLHHGKCSSCRYEARRRVVRLVNSQGFVLEMVFQVSNDGVAFRYRLPNRAGAEGGRVYRELSGFQFTEETGSWLMPLRDPVEGWNQVTPTYENYYVQNQPVGEAAPTGAGWAFPALFRRPELGWALVTEAGLDGSYHASRLDARSDGLYRIRGSEPEEGTGRGDPVAPSFSLPFSSPWRLVILGEDLGPIVESTLVTDVSPPSTLGDTSFVEPGTVAWSWLHFDEQSVVSETQRKFIDMAAQYGFEHCLIDHNWDQQIGGQGIEKLVDYADEKGVGLFLWYNSNGPYNAAPHTPQDRVYTAQARQEEFQRLQEMGIRGVKVDFFGGDKQSAIQFYLDLLRDAGAHDLMVNVHGSTLPRGWQRTYPQFMTSEAVRGYEYITFYQDDADTAPTHATVLPFTRNVVGPMDFTPTVLADSVRGSKRRTSNAFDLAMAVVFESGLQHLGVTPQSLRKQPAYVGRFLGDLPAAWDEIHFVDGFPGRFIALARRAGETWYVAGFNGTDEPRTIQVPLTFLDEETKGILITDGTDLRSLERRSVERTPLDTLTVKLRGHGGFVGQFPPGSAQK